VKSIKIHPKYFFINVKGLMLIYLLLCILSILFSRRFSAELLRDGTVPEPLSFVVFFTIPLALLVILAVSVARLIQDYIARRTGSKFQTRLFAYFIVTAIFTAIPVTVITSQALYELLQFWRTVRVTQALADAQGFAMDSYSLRLDQFEQKIGAMNFDPAMNLALSLAATAAETAEEEDSPEDAALARMAEDLAALGIAGVQDFLSGEDGAWVSRGFVGDPGRELTAPPGTLRGFVSRELPRDIDTVRYILRPAPNVIRLVSCGLGAGFDAAVENIENEKAKFELIDAIRINLRTILAFFYGVFFLPTLLLTMIIAISFTRRVSQPLMELTDATRRVAEGDFSIQIMVQPRDELGLLIRSFNAMINDLKKTQGSLIRAEKISIWKNMAQQLAHEVKNPLTPIKLSAERVLRRWRNDPARIGEIVETSMLAIIQEVEGLSILVKEFQTLSRPLEPSAQTRTPLREAIEEVIVPYRSSHSAVHFDTQYIQDGVLVKMDKRHITQIMTNLIINGIDAMDGAGQIEIRTDLVKKRESRYCRLSVQDSGRGILKEDYGNVFTPYFTTKESGTGLGLPIVERIVNDHGGTIWFNSAEGEGTTFFIDFPLDNAAPVLNPVGGGSPLC
jgi:nitrogen fixation/metabolism regulation signal transduction histidine kinase